MTSRASSLCLASLLLATGAQAYVGQAIAGHAKLLWRRRSIARAIKDPKTPPSLREKLEIARDARLFAIEKMGLRKSGDYKTYSKVDGPYVSYIVSACRKTRFEGKVWKFPLAGSFPYLGFFHKEKALEEAGKLSAEDWDTDVTGVVAYNAPVFANPVPSPLLESSSGELASVIIHEMAHGTVF